MAAIRYRNIPVLAWVVTLAWGLTLAAGPVLTFDHFYDHAELTRALESLRDAYPQFVALESIGKSYQGRDIWAVILNNPKTGPAETKPGFYIDGNIHGNEIQGTEVALYTVWFLLTHYGENEQCTRLLDEKSFYVVPTMNPDSRDYYILKASDPNSPRSGLVPYDDDRDGMKDEDGPDDLNGDGSITQMRRKDPNGNMRSLKEDPRILVPVRPGEKGEYVLLGQEGIDNDGDGRINEDGPGGYDMNRNYGYGWRPNYAQHGAGDYPFSFPETQAVRDFMLAHPNIAGSQNFHNSGGMILRVPGAKAYGEAPPADVRVYDYIGKRGEKILPGYRYMVIYRDLYTVYGGSVDWIYSILGAFAFSNELDQDFDDGPRERGPRGREEDDDMAYLRSLQQRLNEMVYYDNVLLGEEYTDWKPYNHPLYGEIEIGGVKKFGRRVPPLFRLAETCHRNAAFCLFHADQLAHLTIADAKVTKLDGELYQVDVKVENSRATPSMSAQALQKKLHRLDRLAVSGKSGRLVAAGALVDQDRGLTRKLRIEGGACWMDGAVPGFGVSKVRLLVRGSGEVELVYDSLKGGRAARRVTLGP
jgi:hypothetical protein